MSIDEAPSETPPARAHDFSNLQGLQIVSGASDQGSEAWCEALKLELGARATRFHRAVDSSIVLSDDGVIRWLGEPVARLAAGPDLLTPRALVLADASLPEDARQSVAARLELWLTATTQRLLGPLLALRSLEDESELVRQLAVKISDSLGVLEREPVRSQIKVLDQNARAVLRRHGVRFGAYYIYTPQTLKPASRALALQLWSLRRPEPGGEDFAKTLLSLGSSGRTSLSLNPSIPKDAYRVAGFRLCGERVVRVDIIERLADMIRAAFVPCSSPDASAAAGHAFVVSGQMTSLTGCSREGFASILRSLGYESFEIERSRLAPVETATAASAAGAGPSLDAEFVADPDHGAEQSIARGAHNLGAGADPGPDGAAEPSPVVDENPEETDPVNDASDSSPEPPEPVSAPESVSAPPETAPASPETVPAPLAPETTSAEAGDASAAATTTVTAWRPARKQRPDSAKRRHRRADSTAAKASLHRHDSSSAGAHVSRGGHGKGQGQGRTDGLDRGPQEKEPPPPKREGERFDLKDEKRQKRPPRQKTAPAVAQFAPRRPAAVDPTSPFAKLLELRSVLEKQAKNR